MHIEVVKIIKESKEVIIQVKIGCDLGDHKKLLRYNSLGLIWVVDKMMFNLIIN